MKKLYVSDITLRECEKSSRTLSFKEKIEVAKLLDRLNYDYIEMPEITNFSTDTLLIKTVSGLVKNSGITVTVGFDVNRIKDIYEYSKYAKKLMLKVSVPVSTVQMEYLCGKKPPKILEMIKELVSECKKYCDNVEFSALDAFRAEKNFLYDALNTAIDAGATAITVCDVEKMAIPEECSELVKNLFDNVDRLQGTVFSVEAASEINMACANVSASVIAGSNRIKTAVKDDTYPVIEDFYRIVLFKGDVLGITGTIKTDEIVRVASQIKEIILSDNENRKTELYTADTEERDSIVLDENSSIETVVNAVNKLGYDISDADKMNVYDSFKRVAVKKGVIGIKELEAIVASSVLQVPPTYTIASYVINSGNIITATANIAIMKNKTELNGLGTGDGPIDAAFSALENIIGHHYELDDFQIRAVTEGREAMGSALIKLRGSDGKLYSGTGISTDIVGASIRAYLSALNKIVFEENN